MYFKFMQGCLPQTPFLKSTYINEIFKIIIKLKQLFKSTGQPRLKKKNEHFLISRYIAYDLLVPRKNAKNPEIIE